MKPIQDRKAGIAEQVCRQYIVLKKRIALAEQEIDSLRWRNRYLLTTDKINSEEGQQAVQTIANCEHCLYTQILDMSGFLQALNKCIVQVDSERCKLILEGLYIQGLTFQQLARKLYWSTSVIKKEKRIGLSILYPLILKNNTLKKYIKK